MTPDKIHHLPHFRPRTEKIKYIIIHCSRGTPEEQIQILDKLGLSVHYIIGRDKTITEVLPPEKVGFHAGLSNWQNDVEKSLNNISIGIEIEAPTLGQSPEDYSRKQMQKLYELLNTLCTKYTIKPENILGHSDIAPTRKPDPGLSFPWKRLSRHGFGIWYNQHKLATETNETKLLQTIGYDTADLPAARYAFCRHFFPQEVFIESNIQTLVNTPYPANFTPQDPQKYLQILQATAYAFTHQRKNI